MMAMVGQWLGLNGAPPAAEADSKPKPLSIAAGKTPRHTKSEELLDDVPTLFFLCGADESIKVTGAPLGADALARLDTMHIQATADDCEVLADIVDHLLDENARLLRKIHERVNGSSASSPFRHLVSC